MLFEMLAESGGPGLAADQARETLFKACDALGARKRVLALPPDGTRSRSLAGLVLGLLYRYYGPSLSDVLPALGTHEPMSAAELASLYSDVPGSLFRAHDWRKDLVTLGRVPPEYVEELSEGKLNYDWPAQVNRLVAEGGHDLIVSIGQVVPHEVAGMANHAKNVFVGTGGADGINRSHFLGAVYGMERIMGRTDSPVRALFDYASKEFAGRLPLVYALTVIADGPDGRPELRGLFIGDDRKCFVEAAALSRKVNVDLLERPIKKAVVMLDPREFKSTWLGNKAIYRTRMAMADAGELVILAPGVSKFGEDPEIDRLIRRYGYKGTPAVLAATEGNAELGANLSAAAHLIHGSSEGRFSVTYCPGGLTRDEIEGVGFGYGSLDAMLERYDPTKLIKGVNRLGDGEEIFFVPNPAAGLWALKEKFRE